MFERKTAIVIGAGSSYCHGYPLGADLKKNICDLASGVGRPSENPNRTVGAILNMMRSNFNEFKVPSAIQDHNLHWALAVELKEQPQWETIDEFLTRNPKFRELGTFYIAFLLFRSTYERQEHSEVRLNIQSSTIEGAQGLGWYHKFVFHLCNHCGSVDELTAHNDLNVVTFNYDRSLDVYFSSKLFNSEVFQSADTSYKEVCNIHHVYGKLPLLNLVGEGVWDGGFEFNLAARAVEASAHIEIIDRRVESHQAQKCAQVIEEVEQVVILGFGLDTRNMEVLQLHSGVKNKRVNLHLFEKNQRVEEVAAQLKQPAEHLRVFTGNLAQAVDDGLLGARV